MRPRIRPAFIWTLGIAWAVAVCTCMSGCGPTAEAGSPPAGTSMSTTPIGPDEEDESSSSTGEPPLCPWDGACASLVELAACNGWALECGDGFRCVDTLDEAGIVCVPPGEAESSTSGDEESSSSTGDADECSVIGLCENGCDACDLDCDACVVDANDLAWCFVGDACEADRGSSSGGESSGESSGSDSGSGSTGEGTSG